MILIMLYTLHLRHTSTIYSTILVTLALLNPFHLSSYRYSYRRWPLQVHLLQRWLDLECFGRYVSSGLTTLKFTTRGRSTKYHAAIHQRLQKTLQPPQPEPSALILDIDGSTLEPIHNNLQSGFRYQRRHFSTLSNSSNFTLTPKHAWLLKVR